MLGFEDDRWLVPLGIVALPVALVSGYLASYEASYLLWGEVAKAKVLDVRIEERNRKRVLFERWSASVLVVEYRFEDFDGTRRRERDEFPVGWQAPEVGELITIQFVPGSEHMSRVSGHIWKKTLAVFFLSVVAMIYVVWRLVRRPALAIPRNQRDLR